jgi:hypothetical protein
MIQAPESSSHVRKNPRLQFTCVLLLAGVSTTRRGIPKCGILGCSDILPNIIKIERAIGRNQP